LTLEKYCIFLNTEESDKVDSPTLEKSSRFKLEFLEDGDKTTWLGVEDKDCVVFDWYDFHNELASKFAVEELLYLIELPTRVE
jgi:spore coat polysaccharide biosynthesis predicted glycosyltransferase SpsG